MSTLRKDTVKIITLFFVLTSSYLCLAGDNKLECKAVKNEHSVIFEEIPGTEMTPEDEKIIREQGLFYSFDEEVLKKVSCIRAKVKDGNDQPILAGVTLYKKDPSFANTITLSILAVKNAYKGKGIGRASIERLAYTTQCENIHLVSTPQAVNFYTKIAFEQGLIETMLKKSFKNK